MRNCQLLYLIGGLRVGGQERQLFNLLQGLDRNRYPAAVAVWNFDEHDAYVDRIRSLSVPLYSLSTTAGRVGKLFQLRRLISRLRAEVVHSYSFYTNFAAWWGALGTRSVAIGSIRSSLREAIRESGTTIGSLSARFPRDQVSNNRSAAREALSSPSPFGPARVSVVWNGLDLSEFDTQPLPVDGPAKVIGIGSLVPGKRWDRLLEAVSVLKRSGLAFEVRIAGDGPLRSWMADEVRRLALEDRVTLLGGVNDVRPLLAESAYLVHTSAIEGCPNAILEAMASSRAVVACGVGDIPEIVVDQRTGFVVPPEDGHLLAARMSQLIQDRGLCRTMGQEGRARAEKLFPVERMVSETLAAYRSAGWRGI